MSYLNQVITRECPMTRCQCAVMAVLNEQWATVDEIWHRHPVFVESKWGRVKPVCYGTIAAILRGLIQQGFVETRGGPRRKQYREARP